MKSGIYAITNVFNGKQYIGSSVDIKSRWYMHITDLRKGKHHSQKLQRAWDKYSEKAFVHTVLMYCEPSDLLRNEQFFLDMSGVSKGGYNVLPTAGSHLGAVRSDETRERLSAAMKGRVVSRETRQKQSDTMRGRKVSPETKAKISATSRSYCRLISPETRARMKAAQAGKKFNIDQRGSKNHEAKLTEDQVKDIKSYLHQGCTGQSIATFMAISQATVSSIKHGTRWGHLS